MVEESSQQQCVLRLVEVRLVMFDLQWGYCCIYLESCNIPGNMGLQRSTIEEEIHE